MPGAITLGRMYVTAGTGEDGRCLPYTGKVSVSDVRAALTAARVKNEWAYIEHAATRNGTTELRELAPSDLGKLIAKLQKEADDYVTAHQSELQDEVEEEDKGAVARRHAKGSAEGSAEGILPEAMIDALDKMPPKGGR